MTSKLQIYNGAAGYLGERKITDLSAGTPLINHLDGIWDDGFTDYVLEQGSWNFAIRTTLSDYDSGIEPDFGFQRAHQHPTDWIRTTAVSADEYFNTPLTDYRDEAKYLWTDVDELYWAYVSNDGNYGGSLGNWTESVAEYAKCLMAYKVSPRVTDSDTKTEGLRKLSNKLKKEALSKDALSDPTLFPPMGSWARSRVGGGKPRRRGGSGGWRS